MALFLFCIGSLLQKRFSKTMVEYILIRRELELRA